MDDEVKVGPGGDDLGDDTGLPTDIAGEIEEGEDEADLSLEADDE